jgi:predicted metalloprotease
VASRRWLFVSLVVVLAVLAVGCATSLELELVTTDTDALGASGQGEPTAAPEPTPTDVPAEPTVTPTPVSQLSYTESIGVYFADIERFWTETGPALGIDFEPIDSRIPYDPATTDVPSCAGTLGPAEIYVGNAFYCSPDDYIAWDDVGLFPDLYRDYGGFTVGLVIAHEYGHAVQERGGLDGETIFVELQADCLAGAWAGSVAGDEDGNVPFDRADLDDAMGGFLTFADPLGTPAGDPTAHGTAFDRLNAFIEGFNSGVEVCPSYLTAPPQTATLLIDPRDPFGGDARLDTLFPLMVADLGFFLGQVGAQLGRSDFEPAADIVDFGPRIGPPPPCGGLQVDGASLEGSVYLCGDDNLVYVDRVEMETLRSNVGDFAPAYAVAHAFSTGLAAAALTDPQAIVLAADCLVGVWSRDVFNEAALVEEDWVYELKLSAGDLDEGVVGLLLVLPTGLSLTPLDPVATFDRVAAFSDGFFRGLPFCGLPL